MANQVQEVARELAKYGIAVRSIKDGIELKFPGGEIFQSKAVTSGSYEDLYAELEYCVYQEDADWVSFEPEEGHYYGRD